MAKQYENNLSIDEQKLVEELEQINISSLFISSEIDATHQKISVLTKKQNILIEDMNILLINNDVLKHNSNNLKLKKIDAEIMESLHLENANVKIINLKNQRKELIENNNELKSASNAVSDYDKCAKEFNKTRQSISLLKMDLQDLKRDQQIATKNKEKIENQLNENLPTTSVSL